MFRYLIYNRLIAHFQFLSEVFGVHIVKSISLLLVNRSLAIVSIRSVFYVVIIVCSPVGLKAGSKPQKCESKNVGPFR